MATPGARGDVGEIPGGDGFLVYSACTHVRGGLWPLGHAGGLLPQVLTCVFPGNRESWVNVTCHASFFRENVKRLKSKL